MISVRKLASRTSGGSALDIYRKARGTSQGFTTETTYRTLEKSRHEVAHITFKSDKKYAFVNEESMGKLGELITSLDKNPLLRAVFLRSSFPGADIKAMSQLNDWNEANWFIAGIRHLCRAVYHLNCPVIAVVDGPCLGAGMELVASCDLRIAVQDSALFGMPETKLGVPSVAQASFLPGLIGWGRTRELLYFGDTIDAKKAYDWGFVNTLATTSDLDQTIQDYENRIDATGTGALAAQKRVMLDWQRHDAGVKGNSNTVNRRFAHCVRTGRPAQLMQQFLDRKNTKSDA